MIKLSICITAYNQSALLRKNLENILRYSGDDIQVVVSDNCSEEDIKALLDGINDPRIKYCCTPKNVGQDGNIINALRNCDSPYAFLFRTKDTVISEEIPAVIETIYAAPQIGYWRFACTDEYGKSVGAVRTATYLHCPKAVEVQERLLTHPSGEIYNLSLLSNMDLDLLDAYREKYFPNNLNFVAHCLLRMLLASRGGTGMSKKYAWIYLGREAATRGTVLTTKSSLSPHDPKFLYPRYACEMEYVAKELPEKEREGLHRLIIRRYCQGITIAFKYKNVSDEEHRHYNCAERPFSISAERKQFYRKTQELIRDYPPTERRVLLRYTLFCLTFMQIRWEVSHILGPLIKVKLLGAIADQMRKK